MISKAEQEKINRLNAHKERNNLRRSWLVVIDEWRSKGKINNAFQG
jgi:hypothetical protein